jgi:Fe-S-cluster containining protein
MIPVKCNTGLLKITDVDEKIWSGSYFARCMECTFCKDICCTYGCPVDIEEIDRIIPYRDVLEKRTGIPSTEWFHPEAEIRPEFPSGKILRTRVFDRCVFYDRRRRGCHLHSLALEMGTDPHRLKPMVCFLFPITWDGTYLHVAEFLDELPCKNQGQPILESQKNELLAYLGPELVREIEKLKAGQLQGRRVAAVSGVG